MFWRGDRATHVQHIQQILLTDRGNRRGESNERECERKVDRETFPGSIYGAQRYLSTALQRKKGSRGNVFQDERCEIGENGECTCGKDEHWRVG